MTGIATNSTSTHSAQSPATGAALGFLPGRWISGWNAEDREQWRTAGSAIARRNLRWSIFAEFLGFVVWQLWSIVVVALPAAGFHFTVSETFWLISIPSLVGATLRFPYTFMVPRFGGRNWTVVSALLLLIPALGLALCVSNPSTPFPVMLTVAALAGLGGGNFASSMANITSFYPQRRKGWALGLNAAGGNLGAAVAQFVVPIVITLGASTTLHLPLAGLIWVPLILIAALGAWRRMDNLTSARADISASLAALRYPELWLMALLYIGTFGSFIGFSAVFPKLIADQFPAFTAFPVGGAMLSLAFVGALVGSLARPFGGRLADRFGGSAVTIAAFAVMALGALAVVLTLPLHSFWLFLGFFLLLFVASGAGNGATYRMIPTLFALRSGVDGHSSSGDAATQRAAAAALGIVSALGAYGGFLIPQALGLSKAATGGYAVGLGWFVVVYVMLCGVTTAVLLRGRRRGTRI
ncbi:MFS transporter [Microbacterium azadirachtae]|uniref:Nitrate/nitrite transporter NarK n=1 Tax=Microbacterium azadirachtae TaxID=582680 RepID=A0A0F0KVU9_9MICO|nr:MFS transporter [Microbacterium azadirachtae]KJL24609.1 Nitrate/nitrite transporter NarK [Microbacterium azadirachtae]SDL69768.1 MFS transporter, NNP family, nitrate/nitrite transporter [Microbacterium azadirachtae]SEF99304.1 MFS transporter, NNP family, nitrate/nitrite transporter [Microbacterium azadirachtae]SEG01575.1 MFS transporter, NNP family, nitrate/nitrite transporter [Microbacterium azadirachtae]